MKRSVLKGLVAVLLGLLGAQIGRGQGTVYLSNLGQASAGSNPVGSDSWIAASFNTGTSVGGYSLNSIVLGIADPSGTPSGFEVMIYSSTGSGNFTPGTSLGALSGAASPSTMSDFTYIPASSLLLSPNTVYFIVATSGTTVANGSFNLSYSGSYMYNGVGGWQAPPAGFGIDNYQSNDGSHWSFLGGASQFAINATAAPEPGTLGLLALGGLLIGLKRWNEKKRS